MEWAPRERRYDVAWLDLPSLRDVKSLTVNTAFSDVIPENLLPSFRLQHLTLGQCATSTASPTPSSCLAPLPFVPRPPPPPPTISTRPPSVLPPRHRPHHLALPLRPFPGPRPIISSSPSLRHLTLRINPELAVQSHHALLETLSAPIESIRIDVHVDGASKWSAREYVLKLVHELGKQGWHTITEIGLQPLLRTNIAGSLAGEKLAGLCAEAGITVVDLDI